MIKLGTFNGSGADTSGSDGDSNRVLTLLNTGLTSQNGFLVYASGLPLALTTEYTVSHNSTGTQITFLNGLWDDMTVVVNYWQQQITLDEYQTMRADIQSIITDQGISATLIRQTETTATMGDVTDVSEAEYAIYVLIQDITKKDRQIHEMGLAVPGNSKAFFFHEYLDAMTGNGDVTVKAGDMLKDGDDKYWRIEQIVAERKSQGKEIFRTAIIKKIDLDQ
ncbi:MAG: hypothetical protein QQN41_00035 [Nitrosopumilus sp.]